MSPNVTELLTGSRVRAAVSLSLLIGVVFWPALGFDFVRWDDPVNVTQNPLITEPWSAALVAKILNGDTALRFKPLPWLAYRGLHTLFGFNPAAWHALSLGLHLGAALLFRAVLAQLLARLRPGVPAPTRGLLAWVGAAVWAVHPAHVEPACWVTATPYPLLIVFLLGSFWFYVRGRWVIAWFLALAAYATYPVGATYGGWLLAADLWILRTAPGCWRNGRETGRWLLRHFLFLAPAAVGLWITWKSSASTPWLYPAPPSLAEVELLTRLKMGFAMLGSIGTHFLWPFGMTPNNPMIPAGIVHGPLVLSMAAFAGVMLLAGALLRRDQPASTGVIWGSALLALPVLGLGQWPTWAVADRHVYLPHLVLTGALVVAAAGWQTLRERKAAVGVMLLLVAGIAALGRQQVMIWQDTDSLFRYIERQPAFAWNASQQAYIYQLWAAHARENGRDTEGRQKGELARRALLQGAFAAAERGAWAEAVDHSRLLEQWFGLPPPLRQERVRWLLQLDRRSEAEAELQRVQREMPGGAETEKPADGKKRQVPGDPGANHL